MALRATPRSTASDAIAAGRRGADPVVPTGIRASIRTGRSCSSIASCDMPSSGASTSGGGSGGGVRTAAAGVSAAGGGRRGATGAATRPRPTDTRSADNSSATGASARATGADAWATGASAARGNRSLPIHSVNWDTAADVKAAVAITASRSLLAHAGLRMGRRCHRPTTLHRCGVRTKAAMAAMVSASRSTASISRRRIRLMREERRVRLKPGRGSRGETAAWRAGAPAELSDEKASRGESMCALRFGILPETTPQGKLSGKKTVHFLPAQQLARRGHPQLSYNCEHRP